MKKADIRLLAQARSGDEAARVVLGRRYLLGDSDIHQNIATGVDYLLNPNPTPATLRALAETLSLNEFVERGLLQHLETAAVLRISAALIKSAIWRLLSGGTHSQTRQILEHARLGDDDVASKLIESTRALEPTAALVALLRAAERMDLLHALDISVKAGRMHQDAGAWGPFALCVRAAALIDDCDSDEVRALMAGLVELARDDSSVLTGLPPELLLEHLERQVAAEDPKASHVLGLALSGMSYGDLDESDLGIKQNNRRGAALLLRAAHLGVNRAWLDLHHAHSDNKRSTANAEMARFCLEMAAKQGIRDAQRKLGSLLLRDAVGVQDSEAAVSWLHKAHLQGDSLATTLLRSLTVPVSGNDAAAELAIRSISEKDPLLAARLRLARTLGLTLHEALNADPVEGLRPWGLLVGANSQLRKRRMATGRAVPVLDEYAMAQLRLVVSLFASQSPVASASAEGDLRKRYFRLRYMLKLVGARNDYFFASLSASRRESLAGGRPWAVRVRQDLERAMRTGLAQQCADSITSPIPGLEPQDNDAVLA
jgi:hypothetical protein